MKNVKSDLWVKFRRGVRLANREATFVVLGLIAMMIWPVYGILVFLLVQGVIMALDMRPDRRSNRSTAVGPEGPGARPARISHLGLTSGLPKD